MSASAQAVSTAGPTGGDLLALDVRGLVHRRGERALLDGVTLAVRRGEYVALMGPNGSGKTTLVRHLNGLLQPTEGSVHVLGLDAGEPAHLPEIRRRVGLVFQDPDDQMVAVTVEDEIAFGLENLRWERPRMVERVTAALRRFHLEGVRERATTSLSGGEQQRVAIAAVWAQDPATLVLDEPTSMLDRPSATELLALLDELAGEHTIVHVTQSIAEARRTGRVVVLDAGRVVLDGPPEEVFANEARLRDLGILRSGRRITLRAGEEPDVRAPVIEAQDVHHVRRDGPVRRPVLHGASAAVPPGAILAIVGRSGSGKTTLAWHFNRLLEPSRGRILLRGRDVRDLPAADVRRQVGLTFQRADLQLFEITVLDDVAFGLLQRGVARAEAQAAAKAALDELGLPSDGYANRRPATLSVGEQRRVALAGVLVLDPAVLVLDEPTSGLDARGVEALLDQLERVRSAGRAIIVVTHDLEFAAQVADLVLCMKDGRGTASDRVAETLDALIRAWPSG